MLVAARCRPDATRRRALIDIAGTLLLIWPFCLVVARYGLGFAHDAFLSGERSGDPGFRCSDCDRIGFTLVRLEPAWPERVWLERCWPGRLRPGRSTHDFARFSGSWERTGGGRREHT